MIHNLHLVNRPDTRAWTQAVHLHAVDFLYARLRRRSSTCWRLIGTIQQLERAVNQPVPCSITVSSFLCCAAVLQTDLSDVKDFAASRGFTDDPLWWDVAFWAERLREDKYDLKDEELRPYFALPAVLQGLFQVLEASSFYPTSSYHLLWLLSINVHLVSHRPTSGG